MKNKNKIDIIFTLFLLEFIYFPLKLIYFSSNSYFILMFNYKAQDNRNKKISIYDVVWTRLTRVGCFDISEWELQINRWVYTVTVSKFIFIYSAFKKIKFLISISLQPDVVDLREFKSWLPLYKQSKFKISKVYTTRLQKFEFVAMIQLISIFYNFV